MVAVVVQEVVLRIEGMGSRQGPFLPSIFAKMMWLRRTILLCQT